MTWQAKSRKVHRGGREFRGRSTCALSAGARDGHQAAVFAIEPHEKFEGVIGASFGPEDRAYFYRAMLRSNAYQNVRLLNIGSEALTQGWSRPVGLLWLDGDHSYEGVKRDFECWQPHLAPNATIAFDDVDDPEGGPARLVRELKESGHFGDTTQVGKVAVLHCLVEAVREAA